MPRLPVISAAFGLVVTICGHTSGVTLELTDGRTLEGRRMVEVASVAEDPLNPKTLAGEVRVTPRLLLDDQLRRTYIHKHQVRQILEKASNKTIRLRPWQNVAEHGATLSHIGPSIRIDPFDEFGRRIYEMAGADGPIAVVQGISEITPLYTRVQGLVAEPRPIVWDMRLATSSIPRATLSAVLKRTVSQDDVDERLQVVRLYLQSERYRDARIELEQVLADFPDMDELQKDVRQIRQLGARAILSELQLRAAAGQHSMVRQLLASFPAEDVAGETLQQVRELLADYEIKDANRQAILTRLSEQISRLEDATHRQTATGFAQLIEQRLTYDSAARMTSFMRLVDDPDLDTQQKVALALSGWLMGTAEATDNFAVTLSLIQVRNKVRAYLQEPVAARRDEILAELRELEGATVNRVASMFKLLEPPETVSADAERLPGQYDLTALGAQGLGDVTYSVQLPPEYDPTRRYPAILALHGQGYQSEMLLNFWAGEPREDGPRLGQAMRHGYITMVVNWQKPHQTSYEYSAREHAAVLRALRHAWRHFAIDTDRVFLTGHGIGGDAAWDIALAHPDIWAGVMPFLAVADRYCPRYWKNAEFVPWYFVAGEKDGDKMVRNAREFDRYLRPHFDATVVEYQGRGHEPLGDEIQRLFDWMNRRRRTVFRKEFECSTMRPWDNLFWWLEVEGFPTKTVVYPKDWPPPRGTHTLALRGKVNEAGKVSVYARVKRTIVWLAPEMVDFTKPITVELNGRRMTGRDQQIRPDLAVLLEDVRTRGDRQHPFWAKVEAP